jgi:hypothetical protein
MIKNLLIGIILMISATAVAQLKTDSIYVSAEKLINLARKVQAQETKIKELNTLVLVCDTIIATNSQIIDKKNAEIEIYRKALGDYGVQDGKIVWYKNPKIHFVLGVLTGGSLVFIGTKIITK